MPYGGDPPATQSAFHSMHLLRIRQLRCLPQAHLVHLSKLSNGQEDFVEFLRYRLCGQSFLNHSLQFYEHPRASIQRSSEASYSKDPLKFPILARNLPQSKEQKKKEEGKNPHRIFSPSYSVEMKCPVGRVEPRMWGGGNHRTFLTL